MLFHNFRRWLQKRHLYLGEHRISCFPHVLHKCKEPGLLWTVLVEAWQNTFCVRVICNLTTTADYLRVTGRCVQNKNQILKTTHGMQLLHCLWTEHWFPSDTAQPSLCCLLPGFQMKDILLDKLERRKLQRLTINKGKVNTRCRWRCILRHDRIIHAIPLVFPLLHTTSAFFIVAKAWMNATEGYC